MHFTSSLPQPQPCPPYNLSLPVSSQIESEKTISAKS